MCFCTFCFDTLCIFKMTFLLPLFLLFSQLNFKMRLYSSVTLRRKLPVWFIKGKSFLHSFILFLLVILFLNFEILPNYHFLFLLLIHLFICAYIVWAISPPYPSHFQAEPVLPSSPTLLKRKHKRNKKDIAFLEA
jgi:hypothetical protein